jgi:hypothetical protein
MSALVARVGRLEARRDDGACRIVHVGGGESATDAEVQSFLVSNGIFIDTKRDWLLHEPSDCPGRPLTLLSVDTAHSHEEVLEMLD